MMARQSQVSLQGMVLGNLGRVSQLQLPPGARRRRGRAVRLGALLGMPGSSGLTTLWVPSVCVPEMAERHNTKQILKLARDLVYKVQTLIENK